MTAVSWSGPMTPIFALGHIHKKRGEYARPLRDVSNKFVETEETDLPHPIITSPSTGANHYRELWDLSTSNSSN